MATTNDLTGECPHHVRVASMVMQWDQLTFLHWRYPADEIQRLLPSGLTVETFDGDAWVGLVPFEMVVRLPRVRAFPWLSTFPETNVRTYVTAPDGTTGVWFLSLDAARLPAVATARVTYRLPYFWSQMTLDRSDTTMTYRCTRRWPGVDRTAPPESLVKVRVGERFSPEELSARDHWLTARWRLYSAHRRGLRFALAEHVVWPLHRAELLDLDDSLFLAAGLSAPQGDPLVHWSPGVEVRVGFPHRLPAHSSGVG